MTILIPNYRVHSRNKTNRKHWINYSNQKKEVYECIRTYTAYKQFEPINPAQVTIKVYFKGLRVIDTSNIDDKLYIDILQEIGLLQDDRPQENPRVIKEAYANTGEDKVIIEVTKHE